MLSLFWPFKQEIRLPTLRNFVSMNCMPASKDCLFSPSTGSFQTHTILPLHLALISVLYLNSSRSTIVPGFNFLSRFIRIPPPLIFLVAEQNSLSLPRGLYLTPSAASTRSKRRLSMPTFMHYLLF